MFYLYGSATVDNVVLILVYEVALALLVVIDLLPLEAREALWTVAAPAHMGGRRGDCTPHLALHLPSYHSPYSQYTPPFSSAAHNVLLPCSPPAYCASTSISIQFPHHGRSQLSSQSKGSRPHKIDIDIFLNLYEET